MRQRLSFNSDWLFAKGDPSGTTAQLDYQSLKPRLLAAAAAPGNIAQPAIAPEGDSGKEVSFAQPSFDDSGWRKLNLQHLRCALAPWRKLVHQTMAWYPWP